ncbi:MAG: transglutaminase domain-containing protein [Planctomycetota bacterium]
MNCATATSAFLPRTGVGFALRSVILGTLAVALAGCGMTAKPGAEYSPGVHRGGSSAFTLHHRFTIEIPEGASQVRAWLPMPSPHDRLQDVTGWQVEAPWVTTVIEDQWGNSFLMVAGDQPEPGSHEILTACTLVRSAVSSDQDPELTRPHTASELEAVAQWRAPGAEGPLTEPVLLFAEEIVGMEPNPLVAHQQLFHALLARVEHVAKTGATGHRGSSADCFETSTGDTLDLHALYAASARALGLPVRTVYGTLLPVTSEGQEMDPAVTSWIEFNAPELGWIPIDLAIADLLEATDDPRAAQRWRARLPLVGRDGEFLDSDGQPSPGDYFGGLESRRVSWHWGGDLKLGQAGDPLRWNTGGYVEIDGNPAPITRTLRFAPAANFPP